MTKIKTYPLSYKEIYSSEFPKLNSELIYAVCKQTKNKKLVTPFLHHRIIYPAVRQKALKYKLYYLISSTRHD